MATRTRRLPETHPTKTLNTKSAGDILRQERMRQGLSIDEVSQAIKVRPSMLEAIEEGRFFGLTDPLYLKGFIRSYTTYLGLSEGEVMPFFRREYDEQEQQQVPPQPLQPIDTKPKKVSPGWVVGGVVVVAVMLVLGYAYYQYVTYALVPSLTIDSPQDQQKTDRPLTEVTGHTDPDATLTINGQQVQIDPTGGFRISVGLSGGTNTLTVTASNKLGKSSTVIRTVIVPQSLAVVPTVAPTVLSATASASGSAASLPTASHSAMPLPARSNVRLVIGPSSAWASVQVDGQDVFDGVLLPGAVKSFDGSRVTVKSGNAGSTHVYMNGVDEGVMGADKAVVEREYP